MGLFTGRIIGSDHVDHYRGKNSQKNSVLVSFFGRHTRAGH